MSNLSSFRPSHFQSPLVVPPGVHSSDSLAKMTPLQQANWVAMEPLEMLEFTAKVSPINQPDLRGTKSPEAPVNIRSMSRIPSFSGALLSVVRKRLILLVPTSVTDISLAPDILGKTYFVNQDVLIISQDLNETASARSDNVL